MLFKLVLKHTRGTAPLHSSGSLGLALDCVPGRLIRVLFGKCKRLKLVQRIFSPGLPALGAVGQWERRGGDSPGGLDQSLVLLTLQDLQVHDDDLESEGSRQ